MPQTIVLPLGPTTRHNISINSSLGGSCRRPLNGE
jgi:hypothetical protein